MTVITVASVTSHDRIEVRESDLDIVTTLLDNPDYAGCLPADFLHGYSTAAYQIEGGTSAGGRGPSVWDPLFADLPFSGDDACDSYHQWREDVALLKRYGAKAYRFSISWSRIIPLGGREDPINIAGVKYYGNLIDALLAADITPIVTLFHYDTPLALEERYNGWTCPNPRDIVLDFTHYARVCFTYFGDKVKDWITINEPYIFSCMNALGLKRDFTPPDFFAIGHRVTLAHAYAALVYHTEFQPTQNGSIGIALDCEWNVPIDDSTAAREAADAAIAKSLHMFADPLFLGRENETAREHLAFGHPRFSDSDLKIIRQSCDFFGINAYGTAWATGKPWDMFGKTPEHEWSMYGGGIHRVFQDKQGRPIGKRGKNGHPYIVPWGFRQLLNHCWTHWARSAQVPIRVFENGYPIDGEETLPLEQVVDDKERQQFFNEYIKALCDAVIVDGCRISTYMAWSLLDNLEWTAGYESRFGVTHVDRGNSFKRTPKNSAEMLRRLWKHVVRKTPTSAKQGIQTAEQLENTA